MTLFDTTGREARVAPAPWQRLRATGDPRAAAWSHRVFALSVACLFAVAASAFARWQLDGTVVPWDSKNHFYPMFRFLGDALRHGGVPLWNPYHFSGYPAVADPQSLIFTPSMLLFALVAPDASMQVFDAVIMGHLALGAMGMLGLARRWTWHPAAGLLAGLVFMLGGAASSRLQHTGMIISYAWFPLAVWSLQAALDRRSYPLAVAAGLFATLMALGRDQVAYLLCLALVGVVLRLAFRSGATLTYLRGRLPIVICAACVTLACMVVPILLTLQFVHDSNRPGIAFGMALEGSLDPINLLTLFSPDIFGSLDRVYDYWGPGAATAAGNDWTDRTIDYLFAGTLPVTLVLWHGLAGGRLLERGARYFVLLFIAACVYALGRHTPFFSVIFDWVPGVSLYRRPADATFPMNIAFALCSGYLLHRFVEDGLPRLAARRTLPRPIVWATGLATLIGAATRVGHGLAFAREAGHLDGSLAHLAGSAGLAAMIALALIAFRGPKARGLVALALVAGTACQLVWDNAASPLNAEPASTYSAYTGLYPDEAKGLAVLRADLTRREAAGEHPRVEILGVNGSWQNASMVFKLENTVGYNPLRIADYERAVGPGESAVDPNLRVFPETFRGYNSRLGSLLGLDYLVLGQKITDLPRHFPRPRASLLFAGDHFFVYRLDREAAPRAYVASRAMPVDSDAIIDDGTIPDFRAGTDALIDQDDAALLRQKTLVAPGRTPDAAAPKGSATITRYQDDRVTLSVDTPGPGVVVLNDIVYPGWRVLVDGQPAPVLRANLIFRGVEVGPGHHTVDFSFHPFAPRNLIAAARGLIIGDTP